MPRSIPPSDCSHAREAVSARVDGELTELEEARLDTHLAGCPACRRFASELAPLAVALRTAALERPRGAIVLPHRRRFPAAAGAAVAASLVAAVTASSFALGHVLGGRSPAPVPAALGVADSVGLRQDSTRQHLLALLNAFEGERQAPARMRAI